MRIVILAAGIGSRLGNEAPKPLTLLANGKTILENQIDNLKDFFSIDEVVIVTGYKKELLLEAQPQATFVYNKEFRETNTSKSLLCAMRKFSDESILWFDGDVVFDEKMISSFIELIKQDVSFSCVNNNSVGDEEVKYTLDSSNKYISKISKEVANGLGEAVGVNFIAKSDIKSFINRLEECDNNDYYERAFELAIEKDNLKLLPVNISNYICMEVDFQEDLHSVNKLIKNKD